MARNGISCVVSFCHHALLLRLVRKSRKCRFSVNIFVIVERNIGFVKDTLDSCFFGNRSLHLNPFHYSSGFCQTEYRQSGENRHGNADCQHDDT